VTNEQHLRFRLLAAEKACNYAQDILIDQTLSDIEAEKKHTALLAAALRNWALIVVQIPTEAI